MSKNYKKSGKIALGSGLLAAVATGLAGSMNVEHIETTLKKTNLSENITDFIAQGNIPPEFPGLPFPMTRNSIIVGSLVAATVFVCLNHHLSNNDELSHADRVKKERENSKEILPNYR